MDKEGKKILRYQTNAPKGQQSIRLYIIDPNKAILETSSIQIAAHLVAEGDDINDNMEILLSDAGYQKVTEAKGIAYSNGTYLLVFSKISDSSWAIAYKSAGDPAKLAGILQIKDFPYLKKETKMSAYTFEEIEAYENKLGLRKQTKKTATSVTYQAIDPSKVNFSYVRYDIDPDDEGKSGPIVHTKRFSMAMYKQPELRSYFELNGFVYEGAFLNYAEKFKNDELAVRFQLWSDGDKKSEGAFLVFQDAPDLYDKGQDPAKPTFQALYMPLLDVFGQTVSADSPIIERERKRLPECDVEFVPEKQDQYSKSKAKIQVNMALSYKLDPEDRKKPRATAYDYEASDAGVIENINYLFSTEWNKANIPGTDAVIKDFMTKHGFTYKGNQKLGNDSAQFDYYQYYNAELQVYFEYTLVSGLFPLTMGTYTKTPQVSM